MPTYTWSIEAMQVKPELDGHTDVVVGATWECVAVDGNYHEKACGGTAMGPVQPEFTPYADLTQEQVLGWVWVQGPSQAEVETSLAASITQQQSKPIELPLPWA